MTETGLIIAEVAFLLLVYLFVALVVRSSTRDLRDAETRGAPASRRADTSRHAAVAAPEPAPAPVAPARPAARETVAVAARTRPRLDAGLDLAANINPRILVERAAGHDAGTVMPLAGGITIGRSETNALAVPDAYVSHIHARVFRRGQFWFIEDLGSTNGTFVNDRRLNGEMQLKVHDEVRMGETVLRYEE